MYQLFKRLPNTSNACGLQPISQIVREHIVDVRYFFPLLLINTFLIFLTYTFLGLVQNAVLNADFKTNVVGGVCWAGGDGIGA